MDTTLFETPKPAVRRHSVPVRVYIAATSGLLLQRLCGFCCAAIPDRSTEILLKITLCLFHLSPASRAVARHSGADGASRFGSSARIARRDAGQGTAKASEHLLDVAALFPDIYCT
jgi:hypothetical protein